MKLAIRWSGRRMIARIARYQQRYGRVAARHNNERVMSAIGVSQNGVVSRTFGGSRAVGQPVVLRTLDGVVEHTYSFFVGRERASKRRERSVKRSKCVANAPVLVRDERIGRILRTLDKVREYTNPRISSENRVRSKFRERTNTGRTGKQNRCREHSIERANTQSPFAVSA